MAKRLGIKVKAVKFGIENKMLVSVTIVGDDTSYGALRIDENGFVEIVSYDGTRVWVMNSEIGSVTLR